MNETLQKVIRVGSQDELARVVGRLVTVYEDRRHVKEAASRLFSRKDLEELAPDKNHFMAHIVAMGSDELYGRNRNNDGWPHEGLKKKHGTFVTHARNYREHDNKDPEKAIGVIKAARYDDKDTQRVELVLHTNIKKAAEEFERARSGEEMSGSMAANLPWDRCSICGHKSKTAYDRCEHIKNQCGQWLPGHRKYAYMINDDPTFFDYSWVRRPADRIAWYLQYQIPSLDKAASVSSADQDSLRGDELASAYGMNASAVLKYAAILEKLAEWDAMDLATPEKLLMAKAFHGQFPDVLVQKLANYAPERMMRLLLDKQMVMPLESFHAVLTNGSISKSANDPIVIEARGSMPEIRKILIGGVGLQPDMGSLFSSMMGEFEPTTLECEGDVVDDMMEKAREQFSLRYEDLTKRSFFNPEKPQGVGKSASEIDKDAFSLGALYQAYLVKTAEHVGCNRLVGALLAHAHLA